MQDALQEEGATISGTVLIACTPSIAMNFMSHAMRSVQTEHPKLTIEVKIGNPEAIRKWIKSGSVDFGLALSSSEFAFFERTILRQGHFHVFSSGPKVHNGVFVDEKNGLFVDLLKAQYQQKYKKELCILSELGSWELVAQFTQEGLGCGFFPDYLACRYPTALQNIVKLAHSCTI